jgi:uncharacterized membrane protein YagU involved in acid resistance
MMGGFFILLVLILLVHYWYVVVGGVAISAFWHLVVVPLREHEAELARDRLRHEHARQEIDRIALATTQAMCEAARSDTNVIDSTAVEVGRR